MNPLAPTSLVAHSDIAFDAIFSGQNWSGDNRAPVCDKQIEADNDLAAVAAWLALFARSPKTLESYRREAVRLMYWCANYARKPISALRYEDMLRFREFMSAPPLECVGFGGTAAPLSPGWKPFRSIPNQNSVRQSFSVLRAMFAFLCDAGYTKNNPVILVIKSMGRPKHEKHRAPITLDVIASLMNFIEGMDKGSDKIVAQWAFPLMLMTGLRASEVVNSKMSDFYVDDARWFAKIVGKGEKLRDVVIPQELVSRLVEYRCHAGLTAIPSPTETDIPMLFLSLKGKTKLRPITRQGLHGFIKRVCNAAAVAAESVVTDSLLPFKLRAIHAHLFRHTAATQWIVNGASLADVRDNIGHSNLSTLSVYIHPDIKSRHDGIVAATQQNQWCAQQESNPQQPD